MTYLREQTVGYQVTAIPNPPIPIAISPLYSEIPFHDFMVVDDDLFMPYVSFDPINLGRWTFNRSGLYLINWSYMAIDPGPGALIYGGVTIDPAGAAFRIGGTTELVTLPPMATGHVEGMYMVYIDETIPIDQRTFVIQANCATIGPPPFFGVSLFAPGNIGSLSIQKIGEI